MRRRKDDEIKQVPGGQLHTRTIKPVRISDIEICPVNGEELGNHDLVLMLSFVGDDHFALLTLEETSLLLSEIASAVSEVGHVTVTFKVDEHG